jgi:DNA uptake protein ComE-like DNA-binding protein
MQGLTRKLQTLVITALMAAILVACGAATTSDNTVGSAPASTQPAAVSATGSPATAVTSAAPAATATTSQPGATAATATAKLNLNTLTEDQLLSTIPNFSTRMVREFMEYRPYISIQQFRKEIGKYVSAEQVATYEQYVYVPIDVDQADAATLQQLPGVDATIADQLIASRPYGSSQAFLAKLAGLVSAADAQQAAAYLAAA